MSLLISGWGLLLLGLTCESFQPASVQLEPATSTHTFRVLPLALSPLSLCFCVCTATMHEAIDIHAANMAWSIRKVNSLQYHHHSKAASHVKSPVSRAITFGSPICREKVNIFAKEQMEALRMIDKKRWNYDFTKDRPGSPNANYEWKKSDERSDPLGYSFYGCKNCTAKSSQISSSTASSFKK